MSVMFKKETIKKKNLYNRIISLLIGAGWTNVTSNPSTDFDVMYSTGETGKESIYFNIRSFGSAVTSPSASTNFSSTDYAYFSFRLCKEYTPSTTPMSPGNFKRNEAWNIVFITTAATLNPETDLTLYYSVNRDRIIFAVVPPTILRSNASICYFGKPTIYGKTAKNVNCLYATSANPLTTGKVLMDDQADYPQAASYLLSTFMSDNLTNIFGTMFISPIAFGDNLEGVRGYLDGLYAIKDTALLDGDVYIDSIAKKKYKVFYTYYTTNRTTSFPSNYIGIEVE
ncbi:hypothetical protein P9173_09100 [Bacillus safensis]|uniref:hypothetical protein n=1 Tax=Bacillus safensis TaxID=561879 RepID=UPI00227FD3C8|nr:hypothetical protein [Bacillus safensis]MCY7542541.1 hypothetical protein [Bacillus safensis]MCY7551005.1 hypothetical protein [Bacillus safensis]MCY7644847.1 hypothetical protein [Bacillus safensis]MCY7655838.1 hypothetical protein [Bacillus safensis]MEC3710312.1 hypothetical protein [Bacillus safensis]